MRSIGDREIAYSRKLIICIQCPSATREVTVVTEAAADSMRGCAAAIRAGTFIAAAPALVAQTTALCKIELLTLTPTLCATLLAKAICAFDIIDDYFSSPMHDPSATGPGAGVIWAGVGIGTSFYSNNFDAWWHGATPKCEAYYYSIQILQMKRLSTCQCIPVLHSEYTTHFIEPLSDKFPASV
jgi:hypothetical protein